MTFDLNDTDAVWLAQAPGLPEILEAVNRVDQWHERLAEALDFAYRVRFSQTLMNHPATEEMEALVLHLEEVAHHPRRERVLESMDLPYASRWRMLREVLEDRLAVREQAIPEIVVKRRYVREILEKIRDETRVSQQRLVADLGLGSANLSRILGLLATLHQIPSGKEKDFKESPEQKMLRAFAELFRKDLAQFTPEGSSRKIDYLLIDCRTGYPDLADLTMGYPADRIVLVSGLNQQNLHGLELTLKALRPGRIRPGQLISESLVVFSPVPAHIHDSPETVVVLEQGIKIIDAARLPLGDDQRIEARPPLYTLPYTPHLAISDEPVERGRLLGRLHPYWEAVNDIAATLAPEDLPEEMAADLKQQAKRVLGLDIDEILEGGQGLEKEKPGEKPTPSVGGMPLAEMMRTPHWYWPFADDADKIAQWQAKFPTDPDWTTKREPFLEGLCFSTSLDLKGKRKIIENCRELSQFQVDSQLELFQEEQRKFSALGAGQTNQLLPLLFRYQRLWAQLLLGDKAGRQARLFWPLEGRGAFACWESFPAYWFLLQQAWQEKNTVSESPPTDLLRSAMNRETTPPWGRLFVLKSVSNATINEAKSILVALLAHPLPENFWACYQLVRIIHGGWPTLADLVEPVVDHLKRLADADLKGHVWNDLGNLLTYHLGRPEEAETAYRKAMELDPKDALPWYGLGNLLANHMGRPEEAATAYRKTVELDPKLAHPWNNLGNLAYHLDRPKEAETAYRKAMELDPKDVHPWNGLGNVLANYLDRPEEAETAYRKAMELDPKYAPPWHSLGNLFTYHLGYPEEAETAYARPWNWTPNLPRPGVAWAIFSPTTWAALRRRRWPIARPWN